MALPELAVFAVVSLGDRSRPIFDFLIELLLFTLVGIGIDYLIPLYLVYTLVSRFEAFERVVEGIGSLGHHRHN